MAITGARWLLQGLCGNYRGYVAVTGSIVAVTSLVQELRAT